MDKNWEIMKYILYGYSSQEQLNRMKKIKRCRIITKNGFSDAVVTVHKYRGDIKVKVTVEEVKNAKR